jgi:hypothetical protein
VTAARLTLIQGLIAALLSAVSAETVTLSASEDTCLWEFDPDFNFQTS